MAGLTVQRTPSLDRAPASLCEIAPHAVSEARRCATCPRCTCNRDYLTVPLDGGCLDPTRSPLDNFADDVRRAVTALRPRLTLLEQQALDARLSGEAPEVTARKLGVPRRTVRQAADRARAKTRALHAEIGDA